MTSEAPDPRIERVVARNRDVLLAAAYIVYWVF